MKLLTSNLRPLALIVFCTCIGYLAGAALTGLVIGLLIVTTATLFF
jgi:hypothetical protein